MEQELNLTERDPNYINPFREEYQKQQAKLKMKDEEVRAEWYMYIKAN